MVKIIPGRFGDPTAEQRVLWAPLYESVLAILGSTGTIIPVGDTNDENAGRTTVTTRGEEQAVFTYSEAVSAFDTPPSVLGPARIPIITFNGTDEGADTPDITYWSRGDGTNDSAFSIGAWVNMTAVASAKTMMAKYDDDAAIQEWLLQVIGDGTMVLFIRDDSAGVTPSRGTNAAIATSTWVFVTATYDGAGGASAVDTVTLYVDGASVASTAANSAGYVAMENGTSVVGLGVRDSGGTPNHFFDGLMAGGPLAPFFVQAELTADAILRLYQLGRVALDV